MRVTVILTRRQDAQTQFTVVLRARRQRAAVLEAVADTLRDLHGRGVRLL